MRNGGRDLCLNSKLHSRRFSCVHAPTGIYAKIWTSPRLSIPFGDLPRDGARNDGHRHRHSLVAATGAGGMTIGADRRTEGGTATRIQAVNLQLANCHVD